MHDIDASWYTRPPDIRERVASGGVVLRSEKGRVFVALTREKDMEAYVLPKGGVEPGESLFNAAKREILEETGIGDLTLVRKLDVVERLTYDRSLWSVIHFYLFHTRQVEATPTDTAYHSSMSWYPIDQLPPFFWPEQKDLLERNRDDLVQVMNSSS